MFWAINPDMFIIILSRGKVKGKGECGGNGDVSVWGLLIPRHNVPLFPTKKEWRTVEDACPYKLIYRFAALLPPEKANEKRADSVVGPFVLLKNIVKEAALVV